MFILNLSYSILAKNRLKTSVFTLKNQAHLYGGCFFSNAIEGESHGQY